LYLCLERNHFILMKKPLLLLCLLAASISQITAQTTISLTFTAEVNGIHQPLDSIFIRNLTQGGDTTLYPPDTVLVLNHGIGIKDPMNEQRDQMILYPAFPNPVTHTSTIRLWLPQDEPVTLRLYDLVGREMATFNRWLGAGEHSFTFTPGRETIYLMLVEASDQRQVQKLINLSAGEGKCRLSHTGYHPAVSGMKKSRSVFPWVPGDSLRFIGYAGLGIDTIEFNPVVSAVYTFYYAPSPYPHGTVHCNPSSPTAIVDVTNPTTGKIWMDRNLGASQAALGSADSAAYGDLYQWGRFADGHQCRTSDTTTTLSSMSLPGHGNFILAPNSPYDWLSPQDNNLWQGVSGVNNPCPTGYRLPTEAELNAERLSWSVQTPMGAMISPLRLPAGGFRNHSTGTLDAVGSIGSYWSSSTFNTMSRRLYFLVDDANMNSNYRARANSVRCIKE